METAIEQTSIGQRMLPRIAFIACGSFSPPTPMHMRMFEIARDHFDALGTHDVVGGIVSPTHDAYGKKGLASGKHRCAMVKLALQTSDWVRLSDWEINQPQWSRTQEVLQHHQNFMNNYVNSNGLVDVVNNAQLPGWLPRQLNERRDPVQLKLLCGADLLESFAVPGLWAEQDIEDIVANHGIVVISRSGANAEKFIFDSDILTKYQRNITLVTNWVSNEVSSTMIRRLLGRGQSVKYLIDEFVLEYIKKNSLFNYKSAVKQLRLLYKSPESCNPDLQAVGSKQEVHTKNSSICVSHCQREKQLKEQQNQRAHVKWKMFMESFMSNETSPNANTPNKLIIECTSNNDMEEMDETDFNIKNMLTGENRRSVKVFCCGEKSYAANLLPHRTSGPGQAVQVITSERKGPDGHNETTIHRPDVEQQKSKKMRISNNEF